MSFFIANIFINLYENIYQNNKLKNNIKYDKLIVMRT